MLVRPGKSYLKALSILLVLSWIFSGWPQIFDFPPGIQEAFATDTPATIAGTGANDATVGTQAWTATDEITVTGGGDDGVYADTLTLAKSEVSNYLKATNFGFTIPDGSTIQGIKVEIDRKEGNEQTAGGIKDSEVKLVDEAGTILSTSKADTTNFWPTTAAVATYGAVDDLWGEAGGFWTTAKINDPDFGVVLAAVNTKVSGGGATESAQVDFVRITVTYGPAAITVGTTGTQTATMDIPSTNQYVGGAWTFVRSGGTANVTSITISETDATLSAQSYLSNLDLYYETAGTCTYDGTETLFGTDTAFDASEDAVITGTMAVGTSQVCVYAVLDVVSGAPDADTFDLEITNPSTEVVVSAGDVTPATAVAISGATTLNLPTNVFIDHYRWRNDDGYEAGGGTVDVGNIRPDTSDVSNQMTITDGGCTSAYCVWDDNVTQPTAPSTASDYAQEGTDNELAEVNMGTIDLGGGTSPSITIWLYGTGAENVDLFANDSINGQTTCATNAAVPDPGWVSGTCTFATALTQAALDGLTVTIRHNQVGGASTNTYYAVYAQVDKNKVAATWATGSEDTALTNLAKNSNIRLRFQIDNTGGNANSYNYRLEWAARGGDSSCDTSYSGESYATVPDVAGTEHFDMTVDSDTYFSDGDPTTAQLSNAEAYTFVAGDQVESTSNQSGAITLAQNQYTEVEYVFQANANATDGGVYCFRVTNAGTALDSADVVAQVTLAAGGASLTFVVSTDVFPAITPGSPIFATTTLSVNTDNTTGWNVTLSGDDVASGGGACDLDTDASVNIADLTPQWINPAATTTAGNAATITSGVDVLAFRVMTASGTTAFRAGSWWGATDGYPGASLWAGIASSTVSRKIGDSSVSSGGSAVLNTVLYYLDVPTTQKTGAYSCPLTFTATMN